MLMLRSKHLERSQAASSKDRHTSGDGLLDPVLYALGLLLRDERADKDLLALGVAALQLLHCRDQLCLDSLIVILCAAHMNMMDLQFNTTSCGRHKHPNILLATLRNEACKAHAHKQATLLLVLCSYPHTGPSPSWHRQHSKRLCSMQKFSQPSTIPRPNNTGGAKWAQENKEERHHSPPPSYPNSDLEN